MKEKVSIKIGGMSCAACSSAIDRALNKLPGVDKVAVNLATNKANIEYQNDKISLKELEQAIRNTGYEVIKEGQEKTLEDKETSYKADLQKMVISWIFVVPMMTIMLLQMFKIIPHGIMWLHLFALLSSGIIIIWPARKVFISALNSVVHGHTNMDVLIALGSGAAFVTGFFGSKMGPHSFTEIAGMILGIHLTGRYIERRAKGKTSEAIRKLMEMGAKTAIIELNNEVKEVPVDQLQIGDIMLIKPGEKVPTDGIVISGNSYVDESMATGESLARFKETGSNLIGATINTNGVLRAKVSKLGKDTFLAQIIELVEEAQTTKIPIQAFADKITGIFVPIVLLLSILTFLIHYFYPQIIMQIIAIMPFLHGLHSGMMTPLIQALFASISVLVIACPCALGLATPTAIMAGIGLGTQNGILYRNGEVIQMINKAKIIVFDKTGTLTKGKPVVEDIFCNGIAEDKLVQICGSAEKLSAHPLGKAIVNYFNQKGLTDLQIDNFENVPGKGIIAKSDNNTYTIGKEGFIREIGVPLNEFESKINEMNEQRKSLIFIAENHILLGFISIVDELKETTLETIKLLKERNIKTVLLSGDNEKTVAQVGKRLGIEMTIGDVLPIDKNQVIKDLQRDYYPVIMAGDGVNDAPALKQADISIAMGNGTDIAIEAADMVLINGDPLLIIKALKLSSEIFKTIKQNLFWAFFYNLVAIPFAFSGLLNPVIAEIAMAISSITVVTNANRLRKRKINVREEKIMKSRLEVKDMTCNHCKMRITKAVEALNGIRTLHIDLESKIVEVEYDDHEIQLSKIKDAITGAGYTISQ